MITFNTAYKDTAESAKEITKYYFSETPTLSNSTIVEKASDDNDFKLYVSDALVFEYIAPKT